MVFGITGCVHSVYDNIIITILSMIITIPVVFLLLKATETFAYSFLNVLYKK